MRPALSEPSLRYACLLLATDAIPVQQFAGPAASGGYWNDGCLLLTPGTGCKGEGDSVVTATPSDNCMTNNRFQSMYALWTILSFNLLLSGDFANLNSFVMGVWTNDLAVGIKYEPEHSLRTTQRHCSRGASTWLNPEFCGLAAKMRLALSGAASTTPPRSVPRHCSLRTGTSAMISAPPPTSRSCP